MKADYFSINSLSTILLRPLEQNKTIETANKEVLQSVSSKVKDAKSTIVRWVKNKIFILICLSKGKVNIKDTLLLLIADFDLVLYIE